MGELYLGGNKLTELRPGSRRGVEALPHILHAVLQNGGSASRKQLIDHASETPVRMDSYVGKAKEISKHILKPLHKRSEFADWFKLRRQELHPPGNYRIILQKRKKPDLEKVGPMWIFLRRHAAPVQRGDRDSAEQPS